MQQVVLCEDQPVYRSYLKDVLQEIALREDPALTPCLLFDAGTAGEVERWIAGAAAAGTSRIDSDAPLVFLLDIHLQEDEEAGLSLAESIRAHHPSAYIVFVTEQLNAVFHAFRTQPFDFLPKPVSVERLAATLTLIAHHHSQRHGLPSPAGPAAAFPRTTLSEPPPEVPGRGFAAPAGRGRARRPQVPVDAAFPDPSRARWQTGGPDDILQVRSAGLIYRIRRDAIRYVERVDERTYIHEEGRTVSCNASIEVLERELRTPDDVFLRCHRRTLVNVRFITEFDPDTRALVLAGGHRFEVGRRYLRPVQARIRR